MRKQKNEKVKRRAESQRNCYRDFAGSRRKERTNMKYLFASDIHGSAYYCQKLFACYEASKADKLILLGDLLYHGPRNDFPKEYAPKRVITLLNSKKEEILAVRGNCDGEVDQMVLEFPILSDYALLCDGDTEFFLTHGHRVSPENLPPYRVGNVFVYGHTHIWKAEKQNGIILLNPGSVSLPKGGNPETFALYEQGKISIWDLENTLLAEITVK